MNDFPWLTALIAVPLVGAIVTAFLPRTTLPRYVALAFSVLTLVGAGIVAAGYDAGGGMQFTEEIEWISVFGAHYRAAGTPGAPPSARPRAARRACPARSPSRWRWRSTRWRRR
jgi:NADH-quinone oxidoreductase subunit M